MEYCWCLKWIYCWIVWPNYVAYCWILLWFLHLCNWWNGVINDCKIELIHVPIYLIDHVCAQIEINIPSGVIKWVCYPIYKHTNLWGKLKWPYAISRLTAHYMCGLMSDLVICNFRKSMVMHDTECPYWDQVSLNNTNQPTNQEINIHCTLIHVLALFYLVSVSLYDINCQKINGSECHTNSQSMVAEIKECAGCS